MFSKLVENVVFMSLNPVSRPLNAVKTQIAYGVAADHNSVEPALFHTAKIEVCLEFHIRDGHRASLTVVPHKHACDDALVWGNLAKLLIIFLKLREV